MLRGAPICRYALDLEARERSLFVSSPFFDQVFWARVIVPVARRGVWS
jgi:hypothetical protein